MMLTVSTTNLQEAQLSPKDPRYALCQSKCYQIDRLSAWGALAATDSIYSVTGIVLYTHRCSRLNYHTASMHCRACHQPTSGQPNLWSTNVEYHQCCWWHRVFLRHRTVPDYRGGWIQIFGGKASEPKTSRPVEKGNFNLPYLNENARILSAFENRLRAGFV